MSINLLHLDASTGDESHVGFQSLLSNPTEGHDMCQEVCGDPFRQHSRRGFPPKTTRTNPHSQLDQTAPRALQEKLVADVLTLPGVALGRSYVSTPASRAFLIEPARRRGPMEAHFGVGEFAHIHGADDGSLHLSLLLEDVKGILAGGWGEPHPLTARGIVPSNVVMIYAPRDSDDYAVVWDILQRSYRFATQPLQRMQA